MSADSPVVMTVRAWRRTAEGGIEELAAAEVRRGEPELADRNALPVRYPGSSQGEPKSRHGMILKG
ncbi:hypothetical protein ACIQGZ_12705 [Streptomyces sp. NPDC092296]|uniref:hypothetical protein n=1 Tax=Streptomyces sp. NPDC092296 TaxID=3366012 RepID=UPI0038028832